MMQPKRPEPKPIYVTLSAPVGGWNARDSLAKMPPLDAVTLINYFPNTTSVDLRKGYSQHATGFSGYAQTLMAYSGAATRELFAVTSAGNIYDVTSSGAVGAAEVTGLTNGKWQYENIANATAPYIMAVNGTDKAVFYTGSAWARDGDGAPYDITGVNSANCIDIECFKNRVWMIEKNTLKAWYLPTGAIGGAANVLDLRAFASLGGSLQGIATWTIDAGLGVDDYLVFVTSEGQVIVYGGTDPSSASTWALRGIWNLGTPVGTRCMVKWKGDVLILCQDGLLPLSGALQSSRLNPRVAVSEKIQYALSQAVTSYSANFGWQTISYPGLNMLITNVPISTTTGQEQYVMNTITGAWAQFQGWNAQCWEIFNDEMYFGSNTFVGKAFDTYADAGVDISGFVIQAFNPFGKPSVNKRATAMRPYLLTNGSPSIQCSMNWDFNMSNPTSPLSFTPTNYAVWDTGIWDTSLWGADVSPFYALQGVTGSGHFGAPVFKSLSSGIEIQLVNNDISLEAGNFL